MAVRMVMRMLRILPQVELLLKVPIVLKVGFCGLDISVLRLELQTRYLCVCFLVQRYDIILVTCTFKFRYIVVR